MRSVFTAVFLWVVLQPNAAFGQKRTATGPEGVALKYLAQEVPLWKTENGCYSCHNNGDGARVLYTAHRLGWETSESAVSDTTLWLANPAEWENNRGDPQFSDKKLASIQFAAALEAAVAAGFAPREALVDAGRLLLPYQESDGSWRVDARGSIGSPITYGAPLATYLARRTLKSANDPSFGDAIQQADRWFASTQPKNVLGAAASVLALDDMSVGENENKDAAVALLTNAQNGDGGWGPYANAPSEVFDTALAVLALNSLGDTHQESIVQGRRYLAGTQLSPGGWPETTRPPGFQSYAQHISTSAWATLALLETAE